MHVKNVNLLLIDNSEQGRQRECIELPALEVRDVYAERVERFFRQVLLAQTDQRHLESIPVEAWNHPPEEPFDAVHPRSLPTEVIAHLQNV